MKLKKLIIILSCIIIIGIGAFFLLKNDSKLTSSERAWINENLTKVQNVHVLNDTYIFGNLGVGVFYSFLTDFSEEYQINLNKITTTKEENINGLALTIGDEVPNNSVIFEEDHYVLVSKTKEWIKDKNSISNKKIGLINKREEYVKKYIGNTNNTFVSYPSENELFNALDVGEIESIILPRMEYINVILEKDYWINYHFSDLKRNYYITDPTNSTLFQIIKKYYKIWANENLKQIIANEERNLWKKSLKIPDTTFAELQKAEISYGYLSLLPYEVYGDRNFGGIIAEYLERFQRFSGFDIEYKKYNNEKKLNRDINNGNIMLYFGYDTRFNNGVTIETNIPLSYDIYVGEENPIVINSLNTLKGKKIYVEKDSYLQQFLKTKEGFILESYERKKLNDILKEKDVIVAIDHEIGKYLEKTSLKNFDSRYFEKTSMNYNLKSMTNETFNKLLTKYINYQDPNTLINIGNYNATKTQTKGSLINSLAKYALYSILLIVIILLLIYRSSKRVRMQKKLKKEDKLKLIDQLTSLKNRNYLNENLTSWNKNTIYPQSIIMIDLNKIQEINDTEGYEGGDKQIKATANILIKTQLDNTDIIRTDGNEFMIYLVGYNQKQVTSYIHKLNKEFKNLPYNYGVVITYSMITNELKSIEDAINESVEDIKKQKDSQKEQI